MLGAQITESGNIARQYDKDRFFISTQMPVGVRPALWALIAFNYEVARTSELVSELPMGLIRLQWWRDEIEKIYTGLPFTNNDILNDLAIAIKAYDLPQDSFEQLLIARELDLEVNPVKTMDGFRRYAQSTTKPLHELMAVVVGGDIDLVALQSISEAYAMCGILRSTPFHMSSSRCYLPSELLKGFNGKKDIASLKPVIKDICNAVNGMLGDVDCNDSFSRLLLLSTKLHMKKISQKKFDVFNPACSYNSAWFYIKILAASKFKKSI